MSSPKAECEDNVSSAAHVDPTQAQGPMSAYPTSMRLDVVRDDHITALLQEEKQLRTALEAIKREVRKASDAKEANLRVFQPAADHFHLTLSTDIDKLQTARVALLDKMESLKIVQNQFGQMRDQVKLLEFELDPLFKEVQEQQRKVNEILRAKEAVEKQNAPEERIVAEQRRLDQAKALLEAKVAMKKSKENTRSELRDKLLKSGDVGQEFSALKQQAAHISAELDRLFEKRRGERPQNKELDAINKTLVAARAKRNELSKKLDEVRAQIPLTRFTFDDVFRGDLVGKQGATLSQLQQDFGVAINIDTSGDGVAVLLGPVEDAQCCIEAMQSIINNARDSRQRLVMQYNPELTKRLIGTKGCNVDRIQSVSGANVKIKDGEIFLTGTTEGIQSAKQMIEAFLDNAGNAEIPFDPVLLDVIIGKGGSMVRKVEQESGAKSVRILREQSKVVVLGHTAAVAKAKAMYEELIQTMTQNAFTMRADGCMLRSVIGPGGKTIREIQETTDALISCGRDVITIRGSKEAVAAARRMIEDASRREEARVPFPACLYSMLTTAAVVPPAGDDSTSDSAGALVTPLQAIKLSTGIDQIVALGRECVVILRGRKERVAQASGVLEDLIRSKRPVTVAVTVPNVLFNYFVKRFRGTPHIESHVKHAFPDVVEVAMSRGTAVGGHASVEIAAVNQESASRISTFVSDYIRSLEKFVQKVEIPVGRSGAVIGTGGKVIASLQKDTDTYIEVDKSSSVAYVFHPTGDESKMTAAAQAIAVAALQNLPPR